MLRSILACALTLAPVSAAVPQTVVPQEPVPLVDCMTTAGTAFRIGPHLLLSVGHVTSGFRCAINGEPIQVIYASRKADFSMLSDDRAGKWIRVDCRGFVPGRHYIAIGHARGLKSMVGVEVVATGASVDGLAVLIGTFTVQPGQSGGPIIDAETHEVVGTINAADWEDGTTFSVELRTTPICGSDLA